MAEEATAAPVPASYPISYDVEPHYEDRNRLTVAFRIILAIPHWLLVGGPGLSFGSGAGLVRDASGISWVFSVGGGGGVLGLAAFVSAVVSWFAIVFTGRQPKGLWDFTGFYMRWRTNAVTYMALLRDEYPPFGPGDYPSWFDAGGFPEGRNRWSVGLRIIYALPHLIVLIVLGIAWFVTVVIGWFAILFTGRYPESLYSFGIGYLRWSLRVQAYFLLMRDEYPPFGFD